MSLFTDILTQSVTGYSFKQRFLFLNYCLKRYLHNSNNSRLLDSTLRLEKIGQVQDKPTEPGSTSSQ